MFPRTLLASALLALIPPAFTAPPPRDGKQVVEETCVLCHATGREGAPRIGDAKAWAPRAQKGLAALTKSALDGVRKMPPHGGKLDLADLELQRAIAYMVNQSGGNWAEPIDRRRVPDKRSGEAIVRAQCAGCHAEGKGGAPRIGDQRAWVERAKLGLETLTSSAIHGHGAMPARGGLANLTDAEVRDAVHFMVFRSLREPAPGPR
jgi:cytochrome c5